MSGIVPHPDDFGSIIHDITRRLDALERTPPPSLNLVSTLQSTVLAQPFAASFTDLPGTTTPTFSTTRLASYLIIPTALYYTSGGSANYGLMRCVVNQGSTLIAQSTQFAHVNTTPVSDATHPFVCTLPAGTYTAKMQYYMDTGAGTTITLNSFEIDVFEMGS
jgi:hypothetical protein